jgi:hypothetical protein
MRLDGASVECPVPVADLADPPDPETWADAPDSGVLWRAAPGRLLLDVPGVARYLVRDGTLVQVDPRPGAAAAEVQRFLRMTPAAALYLQRGVPVLHAAVAADASGRAVVLAGDSGAGKSVLLAALVRRGWGVLTDDLAPIALGGDGAPAALPTWPEVILWPDSVGPVAGRWQPGSSAPEPGCPAPEPGCSAPEPGAPAPEPGSPAPEPGSPAPQTRARARVTRYGPSGSRRAVTWAGTFVGQPRPIGAVWLLGVHNFEPVEVRDVAGFSRLEALAAAAYNGRIASALLDRASYLKVAGALAGSGVPIRRLTRPRRQWTADRLADIVEETFT